MSAAKFSPAGIARGARVEKNIIGHAYPRNGNVHNPTARVLWVAFLDGKRMGSCSTMRGAVEIIEIELGEVPS